MWSCLFNPCHGVYGVIPIMTRGGQCHDVTMSRVTCDDTTPGPDNPRYRGQQQASDWSIVRMEASDWSAASAATNNGDTNKKSIQEKFERVFLVTC